MNSCEGLEYTLHLIDVREIHADFVISAPLAVNQPQSHSRVVEIEPLFRATLVARSSTPRPVSRRCSRR